MTSLPCKFCVEGMYSVLLEGRLVLAKNQVNCVCSIYFKEIELLALNIDVFCIMLLR